MLKSRIAAAANCLFLAAFVTWGILACSPSSMGLDINGTKISADVPDPNSPTNQLSSNEVYAQLLVTVNDDQIIDDFLQVPELEEAFQNVSLLRTSRNGEYKIYMIRLKNRLDPRPYLKYLKACDGVISAEVDSIMGLANA